MYVCKTIKTSNSNKIHNRICQKIKTKEEVLSKKEVVETDMMMINKMRLKDMSMTQEIRRNSMVLLMMEDMPSQLKEQDNIIKNRQILIKIHIIKAVNNMEEDRVVITSSKKDNNRIEVHNIHLKAMGHRYKEELGQKDNKMITKTLIRSRTN